MSTPSPSGLLRDILAALPPVRYDDDHGNWPDKDSEWLNARLVREAITTVLSTTAEGEK
jgi:hypothetical protein